MTLPDAVIEALARHPDLDALRAREATLRARPAVEAVLPPPMLEAQVFQWPFDTVNPGDAQLMLTMGQDFPGRGKRALRVASGEREAEAAAALIGVRAVEIEAAVRRAYADLWHARQTLHVYDATAALLRQLADIAEAKYTLGRSTQQDIVKVLVERTRLEEAAITALEEARLAEARLNALMRRPAAASIGALADPPDDVAVPSRDELEALATERHPELAMARAETTAADAGIAAARGERRPDYGLRGGLMIMPDMTNAWTATFSVTWPTAPWARKRVEAMVGEAEARREATLSSRRAVENRIGQAIQEAWVRADSAARRIDLLRTSVVTQAEHALEIARVAYQTDRLDFIDLLDAERVLLDSRLGLHEAFADRERALADLHAATGGDPRLTTSR